MINRAALLLKYKQPAVDWINQADPTPNDRTLSLDEVNQERTVYLISDTDADTPALVEKWVKLNFKVLFENELYGWFVDDTLWPAKRTLKVFKEWFEIECHTVIEDTVGSPIIDDEV